jgi:hypothetical protein
MIILFCVFLVQFFMAVACLVAVNEEQIKTLVSQGWDRSSNATIWDAEYNFDCCGLNDTTTGYQCEKVAFFSLTNESSKASTLQSVYFVSTHYHPYLSKVEPHDVSCVNFCTLTVR